MTSNKVLVIGNDDKQNDELKIILQFIGKEPIICKNNLISRQLNYWRDFNFECVIFDGQSWQQNLLQALVNLEKHIPVVIIGDRQIKHPNILANLKQPITYSNLIDTLHRAQIYKDQQNKESQKRPAHLFRSLTGSSRTIGEVKSAINKVAATDATVLILGESGTGKEVVARNLHYYSKRSEGPFVAINCGAISPELLESELFGHEKGAFTGAVSARIGRFEQANNGTLFLDEIGDMPLNMQVKLLRVLQEKTFERVGGNKAHTVDVRIIAATHQNLPNLIKQNLFREDLYYRINVFPITVPALRERSEDIPLLVNDLIRKYEHEQKISLRFNSAAIMALCCYSWPGNVRELANLVERLTIEYPHNVIDIKDLPAQFHYVNQIDETINLAELEHQIVDKLDLKAYLSSLEKRLIIKALKDSNNVVSNAAQRLSLRRTTLVEKIRKYKITNN